MRRSHVTQVAVALVTSSAIAAVVLSQVAFAQRRAPLPPAGVSALIGKGSISPSDDRFQPAAAAVIHEAGADAANKPGKGASVFSRTILTDWIDHTLLSIPSEFSGEPCAR